MVNSFTTREKHCLSKVEFRKHNDPVGGGNCLSAWSRIGASRSIFPSASTHRCERQLSSVIWLLTQPSLAATTCTLENTASRTCEDGVVQAPAPARLIEGRPADRGHGRPGSGVQICRAGLVKNALAMLPRPVGPLTLIIAVLRGKIYPPWPPSARNPVQSSNAFKSAASRVNHSPPARLLEARHETEPRFDSHSAGGIIIALRCFTY